ncbi:MAG: putative toxin-antitoxin system toxin component, PIN family [Lewinellaceae bacterium]|nr:putative toxin-antitoxin system toxin component, PIN family [Lewinellaceae bacterium]
MRVVLDTNVLLVSIPTKSKFRPIFDGLLNGDYELAISNEILSEYVEIIESKANEVVAANVAELLINLENVVKIDVYFKWNLIKADYDDNKFVDCAIAANVKFVVTEDKHFGELQDIEFPKVDVIGVEEFLSEIQRLKE